MSDNRSNGQDEPADLMLARHVRELDREMMPARDLWPGIERRIADYPQPKRGGRGFDWMPWGMAASLLMATTALVLSLLPAQQSSLVMPTGSTGRAVETLQVEYLKARDPLMDRFTRTNQSLAPETLDDLYRNLEILQQARARIEAQVREEPENRRLVELLMKVHEQELELLRADFARPARSM